MVWVMFIACGVGQEFQYKRARVKDRKLQLAATPIPVHISGVLTDRSLLLRRRDLPLPNATHRAMVNSVVDMDCTLPTVSVSIKAL